MERQDKRLKEFESRLRNWQIPPSPAAWSRLEHKLQPRKHRQRFRIFRLISVAAAFLLLVSLGLLWLFVIEKRPGQLAANDPQPVELEPIETYMTENWRTELQKAKALFSDQSMVIQEGGGDIRRSELVGYSDNFNKPIQQPSIPTEIPDLTAFVGTWNSVTGPIKIQDQWSREERKNYTIQRKISSLEGTISSTYTLTYLKEKHQFALQIDNHRGNSMILNWQAIGSGDSVLQYKMWQDDHHMILNQDAGTYLINFYVDNEGQLIELEENILFRREE